MTSLLLVAVLGVVGFGQAVPTHNAHAASLPITHIVHAETTTQGTVKPTFTPKSLLVKVTAYSSTPEETDDTPFITASGTGVRDGIVATNLLPLGSHIKIPSLFGNKVFVVEDRMHSRKTTFVDIWMSSKEAALRFGIHEAEIVVLDGLEV